MPAGRGDPAPNPSRLYAVANGDIFSMQPDGTELRNLTQSSAHETEPALSPDGRKIAFTRGVNSVHEIYIMGADGTGPGR